MTKTPDHPDLPQRFEGAADLEEFMTRPTPELVDELQDISGDILILGAAGKMGPTLARLACRVVPERRVIGVARFSTPGIQSRLSGLGVETIQCDLLDREAVERLPRVRNVIFMAGRKFGAEGNPALTWAMNTYVPSIVAETFRNCRIIAFSTGNIYPHVDVTSRGATERTPVGPIGEYAQSCLGRERLFSHFSTQWQTPGRLLRLNYAIDLRYGVLHDLALRVHAGKPVDLTTGHVNVIWQGEANSQALRALNHCTIPSTPLNITGIETVSIREAALAMGRRLKTEVTFVGREASTAWLNDASEAQRLFGPPRVPLSKMIDWVADWVAAGKESLGKPTGYENRAGNF